MKKLTNLKDVKILNMKEQKAVYGGNGPIITNGSCGSHPDGTICYGNFNRVGVCINNICKWNDPS